jgi:formylglycine-generating enzyme required for sulfatase activity
MSDLTALAGELEACWRRTDEIFDMLRPEALMARPVPGRPPFIHHLGHPAAFAWDLVWQQWLGRGPSSRPELDDLFRSPARRAPGDGRRDRETVTAWPRVEEVVAYRDEVRAAVRAVVGDATQGVLETRGANEAANEADSERVLGLLIEHEQLGHEELLVLMLHLDRALRRPPERLPAVCFEQATAPRQVLVPAGRVTLGVDPATAAFGWEHEFGHAAHDVPAFRIDSTPVMNGEFFEFVEAGGYDEPAHWTTADWRWLQGLERRHPALWSRSGGQWTYRGLYEDLPFTRVFDWPAYTSQAEARAYLAWRGQRLPTEAELYGATYGTPSGDTRSWPWGEESPDLRPGNMGLQSWSPGPVGSHPEGQSAFGVYELIGNGWEWTDTPFRPHPGHEPRALGSFRDDGPETDEVVVLGGSWATAPRLLRRGFRARRAPWDGHGFTKFRGVSDA